MRVLATNTYISLFYIRFMPEVPERLAPYFSRLREEVLVCDGQDEARKFETWALENILKKYYSVEDELIWHPGLQGQDLKIDLAAKRSDGMYLIVQVKWCESENGVDAYHRFSNNAVMELSQALEEIESNEIVDNEQRNLFVQMLKQDYEGDTWRENVQLIFICNTELVDTDTVKNNIASLNMITFTLADLENVSTLDLVAESKTLDVRNWNFENGVGFGVIYARDLGEWVAQRDGNSAIKNQRYFAENLRFKLPNKTRAKEIRERIDESFTEQSELFLAKNNGILVLGSRVTGMENGFRIAETSNIEQNLTLERDRLAGAIFAMEDVESESLSEEELETHNSELEDLQTELEEIGDRIRDAQEKVTGIIISQPSIANGGQTTSAAYDNYISGVEPINNDAQIAIKFVAAPETGGAAFRHEIAVASNRQNAIDERDEVANSPEQRALYEHLRNQPSKILFNHKTGLVEAYEENAALKIAFSCGTWNAGVIRTISNEDWGHIILAMIGDIPHDVQKGKKTTGIFDPSTENYSTAFSTPNDSQLRLVLLGNFLIKSLKVVKDISKSKSNAYLSPFEEAAINQGLTGDGKVEWMKDHKENWQKTLGFTNYWTWAVINLTYRIIHRISVVHAESEGTILEGKNQQESMDILVNLLLTGIDGIDVLNDQSSLDRLWYNTKNRFTTEYDGAKMIKNVAVSNETFFSEEGACSDNLPQLFSIIRRIESVFRLKYTPYADQKSKAFQNLTLINSCFDDLRAMCQEKQYVLSKFGIKLNNNDAEIVNNDAQDTVDSLASKWANLNAENLPVAKLVWAQENVNNELLQGDNPLAQALKQEIENYIASLAD